MGTRHVFLQQTLLSKGLATGRADTEGFFSLLGTAGFLVAPPVAQGGELLATLGAHIRFYASVALQVVGQSAALIEALTALLALKSIHAFV